MKVKVIRRFENKKWCDLYLNKEFDLIGTEENFFGIKFLHLKCDKDLGLGREFWFDALELTNYKQQLRKQKLKKLNESNLS